MKILGLDLETTGLSADTDVITEMGLVLWDTEENVPLLVHSQLVNYGAHITQEITDITGITEEMLEKFGCNPEDARDRLENIAQKADAIAAYNGESFDRKFIRKLAPSVAEKHWIDLQNDIPYADRIKTRKLTHLAAEHGFLNPFAHRAVFDVMTMFKVMEKYDFETILRRSHESVVFLKAVVSFNDKEQAKERGYRWHGPSKTWYRSFKQSDADKEINEAPFRTMFIQNPE